MGQGKLVTARGRLANAICRQGVLKEMGPPNSMLLKDSWQRMGALLSSSDKVVSLLLREAAQSISRHRGSEVPRNCCQATLPPFLAQRNSESGTKRAKEPALFKALSVEASEP